MRAPSGAPRTVLVTGAGPATVVLGNNVIVASVSANKRHWYKAGPAGAGEQHA